MKFSRHAPLGSFFRPELQLYAAETVVPLPLMTGRSACFLASQRLRGIAMTIRSKTAHGGAEPGALGLDLIDGPLCV